MIYDFSSVQRSLGLIAQKQVCTNFQDITELRLEELEYDSQTVEGEEQVLIPQTTHQNLSREQ